MTSCRSPEWPDTLEFLSVFARSFQKRFYFALFAVGYDTGGKGSRADFRVRLPCHKLGPQLLVNRDVVKSVRPRSAYLVLRLV